MEEPVRSTLSVIKADIGSIGGHIVPSRRLLEMERRRQGFFGAAMLPMSEREYTGIIETLSALDGGFRVRAEASASRGLGDRFCIPRLP
jgi:fructose 1,6-bisphosphatase